MKVGLMKFQNFENESLKVGHKKFLKLNRNVLNEVSEVFKVETNKIENWDKEDLKLLKDGHKTR